MTSKTNAGETPLHLAAKSGHKEIVKWLLEQRTNVLVMDNNKMTAYDLAKNNFHYDVANMLADKTGKPHLNPNDMPKIHQIKTLKTEANDSDPERNDTHKKSMESPFVRPGSPTPKLSLQTPNLDNYSESSSDDSNLNKSRIKSAHLKAGNERVNSSELKNAAVTPNNLIVSQKDKNKTSSSSDSSSSSSSSSSDTEVENKNTVNKPSSVKSPIVNRPSSQKSNSNEKKGDLSDSDTEVPVANKKQIHMPVSVAKQKSDSDSESSSSSSTSDSDTISRSSSKISKNSSIRNVPNTGVKSLTPNKLGYVIDHNPSDSKRLSPFRPTSGRHQTSGTTTPAKSARDTQTATTSTANGSDQHNLNVQNVYDKFLNKKRDSIESAMEDLQ